MYNSEVSVNGATIAERDGTRDYEHCAAIGALCSGHTPPPLTSVAPARPLQTDSIRALDCGRTICRDVV